MQRRRALEVRPDLSVWIAAGRRCTPLGAVISLSVNVNKVATVRNSRGGVVPDVLAAVRACVAAGAPGITVHPRGDERHITRADTREMEALLTVVLMRCYS